MRKRFAFAACLASTAAIAASAAMAAEINLPQTISISAYNLGTGSYNETVAIGAAVKKKFGKDFRIIPANNDIARMTPLRSGQVQVSSMGSGVFFAQEGMFEFGDSKWGPQPFHVIAVNLANASGGFFVSEKSGIAKISDLKGKRVPRVRNAPSLSELARAYLAFGGLTWKDVTVVEVAGFGPMQRAFMQGQVDASIATTLSTVPKRADASPAGPIKWLPTPLADKAGWGRMQNIVPFNIPIKVTSGTGVSKDKPLEGGHYPLPVIIAYPDKTNADFAYSLAKAIVELYPEYKDATPSSHGYKPTKSHFNSIHPYHAGAIKYYKEIGIWGADEEKRQQANLKRQKVLADAWAAFSKSTKDSGAAFREGWAKARIAALKAAGLQTFTE
ncbi:MAG: TAXI family TRAP transporter solute-binding subunit [Beijerinckiaceae bacterium]